jgi:rhamnosyl/mannosyltransferase
MNILHLYKDYFPVLGGIENNIKTIAEGQVAAGHQVTVLVCDPGPRTRRERLNGVKVIKAGRLFTAASMPLSLAQPWHLRRTQPDIVHIHSPYPLGEAANWLLSSGRATVISYQSDIVRQKAWLRLYGPFLKRILKRADGIITSTPRYIETSPWLQPIRDRCVVIPNGIDVTRFAPPEPKAAPAEPFKLLFVGRLRYYKGLDTLLEAMPHIPNTHLTIVGVGEMADTLQALTHSLSLGDRVTFAGEVADAELPAYYHQADLFVLPANARSEAYGIVLIEAMAAGLPCVTTELGTGTSWIVQDGLTGLVVPPKEATQLAQAINQVRLNPTLCRQFGQASLARATATFSQEVMLQKIMQLYENLLAR